MSETVLIQTARHLVECLGGRQIKVVLAESCTCGRVAATLGLIPGVSRFLCGSLVVYRPTTKAAWLGLDLDWLAEASPESLACSEALAQAALQQTPEADLALAITGDLDPSAAADKQGWVFLALATREPTANGRWVTAGLALQLQTERRDQRQTEASQRLLQFAVDWLESATELRPDSSEKPRHDRL